MQRPVFDRRVILLVLFNLILVLACLPEPPPPTPSETYLAPNASSPTPLPTDTPTPTPVPTVAPGTVVESMTTKHETLSREAIDNLLHSFLYAGVLLPAQYEVDAYRIWFQTRDENGEMTAVQADLRFPRVPEPTDLAVFVYGAGTTGIATKCAPLNEQFIGRNWGDYRTHMLSYASQGFITILPNWQGYDEPGETHPYFVSELEGRVMLDAARAVYEFFDNPPSADILARPSTDVFLGGYSQGGHGVFAAARIAATYAPELNIRGLIGHAMSPDVEGLMHDSPWYSPYIVYAYRDFYGEETVDPADVFLPKWLTSFDEDASSKCIDEVFEYYSNDASRLFTPEFRDALYSDRLAELAPQFKAQLDLNDSSNKAYPAVPMLLLHGAADPIVKVGTIQAFVSNLCSMGHSVTYRLYPGTNHFQTRQRGYGDTMRWMQQILGGETPVSDCGSAAVP